MSAAYVLDAVRAPFGRYGGGLAKVRPDDLARARRQGAARPQPRPRPRTGRRGPVRRRQPGRRGQPQRRPDGVAAQRPSDVHSRLHGQPPVRLEPRRGDAGEPDDRDRRGVDRARRRGRVDEPRAVDPAQARARVSLPAAGALLEHARLAHGQPEHARPVDDLARRQRREARRHLQRVPRGSGRVRAPQPSERARPAGTAASTASGSSRSRTPSSSATRTSEPTPRSRSSRS